MTRTIGIAATLIALAAIACGSLDAAGFADREGNSPSADGGGLAPSTGPKDGPVDNAVILVHAAKAQSFRLCFDEELDRLPLPDSQVMPEANVVGVEVGSAVRLGPLRGMPGNVFLFDEATIRALYPQFGGAGAGPSCGTLLSGSNALNKFAIKLGRIEKDLRTGVHLLVVRGCPADGKVAPFRSVAECGADWTAATGNLGITEIELRGAAPPQAGVLSAQVVNLSKSLDDDRLGRRLVIRFGDLVGKDAKLMDVASNPPLFGEAAPASPALLPYSSEDANIFGSTGFRVSLGSVADAGDAGTEANVLDQTLERVQELSAPRDLPPTYFATASNYALLLLGDPDAKLKDGGADTDDRRRLHILAVPVIETKSGDAGADGGEPSDGGAAPKK